MTVLLSLLVAIVGILVYALSTNGKVQELGRIAYFAGLLVFLWQAQEVVTLLGR
jgi:hypothetical protein